MDYLLDKNITIVGCGNIGSRHLQGISKIKTSLNIHIIEPNKNSKKNGKRRLKEIPNYSKHNYYWYNNLDEFNQKSDFTIISTSSNNRKNIIKKVAELKHKKILVEKVVCQSEKEYKNILSILRENRIQAWVNFTRRYMPFYKKIIPIFQNNFPINMSITGGDIGLGTNSLHFLDLFSWILKNKVISIENQLLDQKIHPNKRGKIFKEFSGTLTASKNKSFFSITSFTKSRLPRIINISNASNQLIFDESNEKILFSSLRMKILPKYKHVSETTQIICEDIIFKNKCELPTLQESFQSHVSLFDTLNTHIKNTTGKKVTLCPIT